jgi:hypothetical protein
MSPDGNTTVTVVMDDGTTTPGEQVLNALVHAHMPVLHTIDHRC